MQKEPESIPRIASPSPEKSQFERAESDKNPVDNRRVDDCVENAPKFPFF